MADVADGPAELRDGDGDETPRQRRVAPLVVGAIAVVMVGMFWIMATADNSRHESAATPLLDRPAPEAIGVLADGTPFDLSRRKGSWVVMNFFSHNCVGCIVEHDELIEFVRRQRELGAAGAEFYSIVRESTRDEVDEFFAERGGGDWGVVYDDDYSISNAFGVVLVPETWIIDPNGVVYARWITTVTADELEAVIGRATAGA